jgi:DNA adenine methylase
VIVNHNSAGNASPPRRPALRYHGGKWLLADWIIEHFPPHCIYVEPFAGAASVLLQKPRSQSEVYNDRWRTVVNVFRVLRDPEKAKELKRLLELTPYARDEFEQASAVQSPAEGGDVECARRTILRSYAGFGSSSVNGEHSTGFRRSTKRTAPAYEWADFPRHIDSFTERLRGVVIENRPALDVIAQHDSPETLFYLDPPYPHATRNMRRGNANYAEEMTDDDHRALAGCVKSIAGMVVLSGYPCDFYDCELFPTWLRVEKSHRADGARLRTEVLWINPSAASKLRQLSLSLRIAGDQQLGESCG